MCFLVFGNFIGDTVLEGILRRASAPFDRLLIIITMYVGMLERYGGTKITDFLFNGSGPELRHSISMIVVARIGK